MKAISSRLALIVVGVFLALGSTLVLGRLTGGKAAGLSLGDGTETALGPEFTYQGRLLKDGQAVSGVCDFKFTLYNAASGGSPLSDVHDLPSVTVTSGLFTVLLGFDPTMYNGQALYLEVSVRCPAGQGDYALLGRQPLTAAPYSQYSQNSNLLDGMEGAAYQARVNGVCPAGRVMVGIGPDGAAICSPDAPFNRGIPPQGNSLLDVDAPASGSGGVGYPSSVSIAGNGLPLIAYYDLDHQDLRVAACHDLLCSSAQVTTIDPSSNVGGFLSLAVGADGLGLIGYSDDANFSLKVAHCNNMACSSATITTLDGNSHNPGGDNVSATIGPDGLGLIAYRYITFSPTTYNIKVAHCSNPACTAATLSMALTTGYVQEISLAAGVDGLGLITYWDTTALKVVHCNDPLCTSTTPPVTIDAYGSYNSIAIGADGLALIAYFYGNNPTFRLRAAHCSDVLCSAFDLATLEDVKTAYSPSVTIGADGLGLIAYFDATNYKLQAVHCTNLACSKATVFVVDNSDHVGYSPSVTIGSDGLPFISYANNVSFKNRLRVAHCASAFCTPYFWRR